MTQRHIAAQLVALLLLVSCTPAEAPAEVDAGDTADAGPPTDAGPLPTHCRALTPAECQGDSECALAYDYRAPCCTQCNEEDSCGACGFVELFGCRARAEVCNGCFLGPPGECDDFGPVDCSQASPDVMGQGDCTTAGCARRFASVGGEEPETQCVEILAESCTATCERAPPECPNGSVPEGDGSCFTGFCIAAHICNGVNRADP